MENLELKLKETLTALEFENIHRTLGISKRMVFFIFKDPSKIDVFQLKILSNLLKMSMDNFFESFINS